MVFYFSTLMSCKIQVLKGMSMSRALRRNLRRILGDKRRQRLQLHQQVLQPLAFRGRWAFPLIRFLS